MQGCNMKHLSTFNMSTLNVARNVEIFKCRMLEWVGWEVEGWGKEHFSTFNISPFQHGTKCWHVEILKVELWKWNVVCWSMECWEVEGWNKTRFSTFNISTCQHVQHSTCQYWEMGQMSTMSTCANVEMFNIQCWTKLVHMLKFNVETFVMQSSGWNVECWQCWNDEGSTCWEGWNVDLWKKQRRFTAWGLSTCQHFNMFDIPKCSTFNISTFEHFQHFNVEDAKSCSRS